ncbi:hypothetical protein ACPRNU_24960 [Chromobacterium vaccinii]|uniref:hypothetical protein n=1 Tax=Chromobacterium vaccinii TaxID=1108595 RepID=UPI003C72EBF5
MFTILGYEEAVNSCDCCGKSELKGTFAVQRENGDILYFGSVCVTRHTGKPAKQVRAEACAAVEERIRMATAEYVDCPERVAVEAKREQTRLQGISVGVAFRNATKAESDADNQTRALIAAKFGLKPYQIRA